MVKKAVHILKAEGIIGLLRKVWEKKSDCIDRLRTNRRLRSIHMISRRQRARQKQYTFEKNVKFSIITPLYNTPKAYLVELIKSLEKQTYPDWELCLADGSDRRHSYVKRIDRKSVV